MGQDPFAMLEQQLAAMLHLPAAFDQSAELPPGVEPNTIESAQYLRWAEHEAERQSFNHQDFK